MKHRATPKRQSFKPSKSRPTRLLQHHEIPSLWLVHATIGEHNNVELTVPASNIMDAGLKADAILNNAAFSVYSKRRDFQTQSITQLS